jgi:hypothetical protein
MPMYRVTVRMPDGTTATHDLEAVMPEAARSLVRERHTGIEVVSVRRLPSPTDRPSGRPVFRVETVGPSGLPDVHRFEADDEEAAAQVMRDAGHTVERVVYEGDGRPVRTVGEMTPHDFGWLITKHVVIALAIWWVISTLLGLLLVGMFGGPSEVSW